MVVRDRLFYEGRLALMVRDRPFQALLRLLSPSILARVCEGVASFSRTKNQHVEGRSRH